MRAPVNVCDPLRPTTDFFVSEDRTCGCMCVFPATRRISQQKRWRRRCWARAEGASWWPKQSSPRRRCWTRFSRATPAARAPPSRIEHRLGIHSTVATIPLPQAASRHFETMAYRHHFVVCDLYCRMHVDGTILHRRRLDVRGISGQSQPRPRGCPESPSRP